MLYIKETKKSVGLVGELTVSLFETDADYASSVAAALPTPLIGRPPMKSVVEGFTQRFPCGSLRRRPEM